MATSIKIGFLDVGINDVLDILLVGIIMYQLYKILRGSLGLNIFIGMLLVFTMSRLVKAFNMRMLSGVLDLFATNVFVFLIIIFQQEIRRFLFYLGRGSGIGKDRFWERLFNPKKVDKTEIEHSATEIVRAIHNMSAAKTGALIVFTDESEKQFFNNTGVPIDGDISSKLLESIFEKNSPLHDGAMVIAGGRIISTACVLPVSENPDLPTRVGMRHRAAVGITEQIDATVVIVSEETGKISWAKKGKLSVGISLKTLRELLLRILQE